MIETACLIAVAAISVSALLNLYRLGAGPDVLDRILSLETLVINTIGLVVVIGIWFNTSLYFEVALAVRRRRLPVDGGVLQVSAARQRDRIGRRWRG